MAKYRVLQTSFINNTLIQAGEVIDYDGDVADNLEPVTPAKVKAKVQADLNALQATAKDARAAADEAQKASDAEPSNQDLVNAAAVANDAALAAERALADATTDLV